MNDQNSQGQGQQNGQNGQFGGQQQWSPPSQQMPPMQQGGAPNYPQQSGMQPQSGGAPAYGQPPMPPMGAPPQYSQQQPGMDPYGMPPTGQGQAGGYGADPYGMPPPQMGGQDPYAYGAPDQMGQPGQPGQPGAGGPPRPPSPPANFQLGALLGPVLKVKVPPHTLQFDEQYFLHLLAGSISLTKDEKKRIVESIPKLKQSQIDELVRIFEEERKKFAELGQEHVPQLEKLAQQHYQDWLDIELAQEQTSKADEDAKKAEELRKQIGL